MAQIISLLPNPSDGLVDEFGNGLIENAAAEMFALPTALADQPQSQWYIAQWGQPIAINPANYAQDNASADDPLYGNALYAWSEPGTSSAIAIYQNTAATGGDVYDLTDANTTAAPSSGATDESDLFLSSPAINANLSHPITLSLDAKITQSLVQFASSQIASDYATSGTVFGTFDIGMTVNFNGAGGLPAYVGFVQIVPWTSDSTALADYENAPLTPGDASAQFISSQLMSGDPSLSLLPSDAGSAPDTLTYDINKYVYAALTNAYSNFSPSQQLSLLNLANWTLGSLYIGPATNDAQVTNAAGLTSMAATVTTGIQVSNISLTENVAETYNPEITVPAVTLAVAAVPPVAAPTVIVAAAAPTTIAPPDINPQIAYNDHTIAASGTADGAAYTGMLENIQDQYIYSGADNISLTAPAGANWEFGGGSGITTLTAISGDNILVASTNGSTMVGGTGTDQFVIPDANSTGNAAADSIVNFNPGDTISLAGIAGAGWTYGWYAGDQDGGAGLTLVATSIITPGLKTSVTLAGLSMNDLSSLTVTPGASGDNALTITRAAPQISTLDLNSGAAASEIGTTPNIAGIDAEYLYTGTNAMAFMAPAGENWEFGGGSSFTQLSAVSGNNIYLASTGGSTMLGGSGNDIFDIPDANLTGAAVWDSITNFHQGDSISLAGLAGAGWTYNWTDSFGSATNPALTLQATSTSTPGVTELVTLNGLSTSALTSLTITQVAGALNVTH